MRNLKTIDYLETKIQHDKLPLTATAWDTAGDTIICSFGPTPTQPVIELKRRSRIPSSNPDDDLINITSWDAPCPLPELECDEILLLQYFADTATSCLVLAGGDVIVVRENPTIGQEKIEIVGSVDVGICAAAWAPDEELIAIVTKADTLVLMSRTFEPLNEATLSADDLKASKHVSVGWGKAETQFQGRRAKAMKDPTVPDKVDQGLPSMHEDGRVTISWRGDGQYFAINSVIRDHRRVVRVFSREAVLDSASEPVDGLESALSWKPSGQLLAGIKRSEDKAEVVFFERNGLRHGQFDLRLTKDDLDSWASSISLSWNTDSSVLGISFRDRVQFWTMGNYHYYLKLEVPFYYSTKSPAPLRWHPEIPLRITFAACHYIMDYTFLSTVARGSVIPPYDHGIVAVIDGKSLKLTPFRQSGAPPPMAFCEKQFMYNIIDCAFSKDGQRLVVLTTDTLELCQWSVRSSRKQSNAAQVRFTTSISSHSIQLPLVEIPRETKSRYTQIALKDDEIYVLAPKQSNANAIIQRTIWHEDPSTLSFEEHPIDDCEVTQFANNLLVDAAGQAVFSTDSFEGAHRLDASYEESRMLGSSPNSSLFTLGDKASRDDSTQINGHSDKYHIISLSPQGALHADRILIARDCTSYILTNAHLIFTTSQHLLKFVHLTEPTEMQVPGDTPEVDERCRSIERGAKIVTVVPSSYAVILQMPRGNLETIYPRLLVLSGVRAHIRQRDYLAAFLACQTHQVDLNILHDYDPQAFLANVSSFIDQLKKPARVDEFLSKLKDEDVTETLYRDTLNTTTTVQTGPKNTGTTGKVNRIADAILTTLSSKPSVYSQNIITAHVCKRPPDLSSALLLVSTLRQTSESEADLAVSHLCFLTDATRLFDAALALYDLELTLLVAQNAQRDPREYIPFLQSLQDLPVLRRQYTIDNHLHKYAKAVVSLHALAAHDEVESYTVKHSLYTTTMNLYKYDAAHLANITRLYATHLASQSNHSAAATLFDSLADYTSAYPLYALAHQWRESLTCATLASLPPDQLTILATNLATTLTDETRDFRAASTIHLDYLSDPTTAAKLLCRGSYFAEASRILTLHSLTADTARIIEAGLTEKVGEILELVAECKTQLAAQVPRILELRVKKQEDPLAFYGGDPNLGDGGVDIPDNVSLAPTDTSTVGGRSLFTRYGSNASKFGGTVASNVSRKTSRTKRREERKRARGKKGSVYEEEYIVASVGRLIERVNGVHDEVGRLVGGLLRRGMRERAARVEEVMREIVELCEKARVEVWGGKEEQPEQQQVQDEGTYDVNGEGRPSGGDGVLWDSQQETSRKKEPPEVKAWSGSELVAS